MDRDGCPFGPVSPGVARLLTCDHCHEVSDTEQGLPVFEFLDDDVLHIMGEVNLHRGCVAAWLIERGPSVSVRWTGGYAQKAP